MARRVAELQFCHGKVITGSITIELKTLVPRIQIRFNIFRFHSYRLVVNGYREYLSLVFPAVFESAGVRENRSKTSFHGYAFSVLNQPLVLLQNPTSISINGTSIKTPTTVARAAPDESPNSITDVAIATSK